MLYDWLLVSYKYVKLIISLCKPEMMSYRCLIPLLCYLNTAKTAILFAKRIKAATLKKLLTFVKHYTLQT
jgi:hypothetical protein